MTKLALEGLIKAIAVEPAPHNIPVNSVAPMTVPLFAGPEFRAIVENIIPLSRIGQLDDVAAAVIYFVSLAADMVTCSRLMVNCGWTASSIFTGAHRLDFLSFTHSVLSENNRF